MGGPTRIPTLDASFPDSLLPLSASNMAAAASQGSPGLVTLTDAATIATDCSLGNAFVVTLGGNRTLGAPSNPKTGQRYTWIVVQDSNGTRTLAYNAAFDFGGSQPTIFTGNGAVSVIEAVYDGTKFRAGYPSLDITNVATQVAVAGSGTAVSAPNGTTSTKNLAAANSNAQAISAVSDTVACSALVNAFTTGSNLTLTSTPSITAGATGQLLILVNNGSNNLVLQDRTTQLVGSGIELGNAKITLTLQPGCGALFCYLGSAWFLVAGNGTLA